MKAITIPPDALARFRAAASEFSQSAKARASRLEVVRDDIAALRVKGASFRTISELLDGCGIRASDTCVMRFCQRVLGEAPVRARKSKRRAASGIVERAAPKVAADSNGHVAPSAPTIASDAAQVELLDDLLNYQPPGSETSGAPSGPRIAKIKFANPGEL